MSTNKPMRREPTGIDAMQAGRLAQRHYELVQAWEVSRNPHVSDALDAMRLRCKDHHARTGWVAYHDGESLVYYYTSPDTGEGDTQ